MSKKKNPIKEVVKFAVRMVVLSAPFLVSYFTDRGSVEVAGLVSAVLVLADKYSFENGSKLKLPF